MRMMFGTKLTLAGGLALGALLLAVGCNSAPPAPDTKAAEEAVRKADADWAKASKSGKVDDWVAFYSEDVVLLPPNDKTVTGKASVRKPIADLLALPELSLTWEPTKVEVAPSADLAYMVGTYQMSWKGSDGKPVSDSGKTIEIWKKQADGSWKCVVDGYSSDLPAAVAK